MRVLVTGATGCLGPHVVDTLAAAGHDVTVLARPGTTFDRLGTPEAHVGLIRGDLADPASYDAPLRMARAEAVVHLAWRGVAPAERNDARQLDNLAWSMALMNAAARSGARHWIALGSQAEYGPCVGPITETTPTMPTSTYGMAKLASAWMSRALASQLGVRMAWLRLFACYGPGDRGDSLVPYLVRTMLAGGAPRMTAGEQRWDYLHVRDVASAIVAAVEQSGVEGFYNVGSGEPHTLRWVAESIRDCIDPALAIDFGALPYRPDQVMEMQADATRFRTASGWAPRVPIGDGLRETVEWYARQP